MYVYLLICIGILPGLLLPNPHVNVSEKAYNVRYLANHASKVCRKIYIVQQDLASNVVYRARRCSLYSVQSLAMSQGVDPGKWSSSSLPLVAHCISITSACARFWTLHLYTNERPIIPNGEESDDDVGQHS
ncbi:hypothetical protein BJ166DRAFT_544512 [Pestalotiopsis sp. NC0098]|nr:hypothetical protein BJ166DRAFT_544512 [Pestalotiopsis sp. NC0098]